MNYQGNQNPNIKKIYLHIGMTKTGTSSIQTTLSDGKNNVLLNEFDIHFPREARQKHLIVKTFLKNTLLGTQSNGTVDEVRNEGIALCNVFREEVCQCSASNIILSAEAIISFNIKNLEELKRFLLSVMPNANIEIIIFVREFMAWTASSKQQCMKQRGTSTKDYIKLRNGGLEHTKRISRVAKVFGKNNISVHKFEDACKNANGPVGYFIELLGVDKSSISKFNIIKKNQGVSYKALHLIQYINLHIPQRTNFKFTLGRSTDDTKPLHVIRGKSYKIEKKITSAFRDIVKRETKFIYDEYGIDYSDSKYEYQAIKKNILIFDERYYEDIILMYNQLTDTIKKLIFDYLNRTIKRTTQRNGKKVLIKTKKWIQVNYAYILNIDVPNKKRKKEYIIKKMIRFFGEVIVRKKHKE